MKVNEIFYSLQGEGRFTGTPAVFLRLSGCNLHCDFCDTQHEQGREMTDIEIFDEILKYPAKHIVITGGEPSLQLTFELIEKLHKQGYFVQVETNGAKSLPGNVDWVTYSPKTARISPTAVSELKIVYRSEADEQRIIDFGHRVLANAYYVQPCDTQNAEENAKRLEQCIKFVKKQPKWKLSIQLHKVLNIQ